MPLPNVVVTDFTKAPEQIITDLINFDNGTTLDPATLLFSDVTASSGTRNTSVLVSANNTSLYAGSVTLFYNRIDLATIPGIRDVNFEIGSRTKMSEIIPDINARFGINLTPADYKEEILPLFSGNNPLEKKYFDVDALPGSLIFIGELGLTITRGPLLLSTIILNRVLNGLTYIQPAP